MRYLKVLTVFMLIGCGREEVKSPALFSDVTDESGVTFANNLQFTERLNPYTYRNFYNGGGVAIGDINNDGLSDIYFTGNQVDNKLYLNKGGLKFEDITDVSGVACRDVWSTGVTFVDINADGWLDIYICKSGDPESPRRHNELFINNKNLTFTEQSKEYGLDVTGLSVHASFFDFDKDNDLDCYLLTNSLKSVGNFDLVKNQREVPDSEHGGNKFFVNENGKFIDRTAEVGIYHSNIGFGLGITLGDFNNDTWADIFISNDFFERDYLYINNKNGGFDESLTDYFESISMGSMGADLADLDNDGVAELFVTEMLPDSLARRKTKTVFESWNKYQLNVASGYHHQVSRNVLQKKINAHAYAEIGRLTGVAATEWSWGALLFDMNNDGFKDIFVANGIYKDLLDRDYLTYSANSENIKKLISLDREKAIVNLIELMPSSAFANYAFVNEGDLRFRNAAEEFGLNEPLYSNGSAYGDLDNDGDLDLVVTNINAPASIYQNNTDSSANRFTAFEFSGIAGNTLAIGTQVIVYCGSKKHHGDNYVTRGFQSSVEPRVTIGLGPHINKIDSAHIQWPDGAYTFLYDLPVNKKISVDRGTSVVSTIDNVRTPGGLPFRLDLVTSEIFQHRESGLNDFDRDRLLPMMYSNETPSLIKGDIDQDGVSEFYVGGGKTQSGLFLKFANGKPRTVSPAAFTNHALAEETGGALFDADGDGDLDLYMSTGGRFFPKTSDAQVDRLFLNREKGQFTEKTGALPFRSHFSTSIAKPIDFDRDGDMDLIVAERFDPFTYGLGGRAYLLSNNGLGEFTDVTEDIAVPLLEPGMITTIAIVDISHDGWDDIVLAGDWMPIVVLENRKGTFQDISEKLNLQNTRGWWRDLVTTDLNGDKKADFILGNHGLNSVFKSGDRMYVNDFDGNGSVEQIFCTKVGDQYFPIVDRDELISQLPALKKKLLYYSDYGRKPLDSLFPQPVLKNARVFEVDVLASVVLLSNGEGYILKPLPLEAQFSSIYSLSVGDFDDDGVEDVIAGGNQFRVKPQFGRQDASSGWFLKGVLNSGEFSFEPGISLGVSGEIRDIDYIHVNGINYILFAKNNDNLEIYKISD